MVKVSFYVVLPPEADYGGPQYPDGTNSICLPRWTTPGLRGHQRLVQYRQHCRHPELSDEARELN